MMSQINNPAPHVGLEGFQAHNGLTEMHSHSARENLRTPIVAHFDKKSLLKDLVKGRGPERRAGIESHLGRAKGWIGV